MLKNILLILIGLLCCNITTQSQNWHNALASNQVKLHALISQYDPERYNLKIGSESLNLLSGNNYLEFMGSKWQIDRLVKSIEGIDKYQIEVIFKCLSGEIEQAAVSVDFDFFGWSIDNYVLMPGAVYNGNRYPFVSMGYSPFFVSMNQMGPNKPIMLSDVPKLNFKDGYSCIQERSGSMTFPGIGFHAPGLQKGFWLCFEQGNSYGDYGVGIVENKGRDKATMSITSPLVREVYKYHMCTTQAPSYDQPANFKAGDEVVISFVVDFFESFSVQSLFNEMVELRQELYPEQPKPNLIPFSESYLLIEQNKNKLNWRDEGYYASGVTGAKGRGQDWRPGWVGGLPTTYALLANGTRQSQERVIQTLDWLYPKGLAPSGVYYEARYNGEFISTTSIKPFGDSLILTRMNADAVYFALRQFDLLKKMGQPVKETWWNGNMKALEAQLKVWEQYGQLGQRVNSETGELIVGNTTSAGIFPAALCEAYHQTHEEKYLIAAKQIAEYYYLNFIVKGLTCGGPGDALQNFDSESSYALLESFTALFETTGNKKWLKIAEEMANQFASWVVAYDYKFPTGSTHGKLDMLTSGTVYANTQNKHTAPGICTHSGIALLKLYRATQKCFYLNLLVSIAHAIPQYMSCEDRKLPDFENGWISERINMTDWLEGIGETAKGSTWAETSMMLTYAELPGIYVNKDNNHVFILDHVDAKLNKKGQLEIFNPTNYEAEVKILAENSLQMQKPLGINAFINWKKVKVPAKKKVIIKI